MCFEFQLNVINWGTIEALATALAVVFAVVAWKTARNAWSTSQEALNQQRKHDKLMVRPRPFIRQCDYENMLEVLLLNGGTGPLIIKAIAFRRKGCNGEGNSIHELISADGFKYDTFLEKRDLINRAIGPGKELTLFKFSRKRENEGSSRYENRSPRWSIVDEDWDEIRARLSRIEIVINYGDISEGEYETFKPETFELNIFSQYAHESGKRA